MENIIIDESNVRAKLSMHGLERELGLFKWNEGADTFGIPVLEYGEYPFLDFDRTVLANTTRKRVFEYKDLMLKTGKPSPHFMILPEKDHNTPIEKDARKIHLIDEFENARVEARTGLAVEPVAIFYDRTNDEFYLAEPLGVPLIDRIKFMASEKGEREFDLTVGGLHLFGEKMRRAKTSFITAGMSDKQILSHIIRYDKKGHYDLRLTDNPRFFYNASENRIMGCEAKLVCALYEEIRKSRQDN